MHRLITAAALLACAAACLACTAPPPRSGPAEADPRHAAKGEVAVKLATSADAKTAAKAKRRADAEAEAEERNRANRKAYELLVASLKERHREAVAKYAAAKATFDEAFAPYQKEKAEHDAAKKLLAAGRIPQGATANLRDVYRRRWQEIVKQYPDTQAARDADALLKNRQVPFRLPPPEPMRPVAPSEPPTLSLPPEPTPVPVIYPPDPDEVIAAKETPAVDPEGQGAGPPKVAGLPSGGGGFHGVIPGPKTVYVHGYTTKNGTYVPPHMRAAPGSGKHR